MSLTNTTTKTKYTGDGANTTFAITFDFILNASECQVILRDETVPTAITETLLTNGAEYNLTGASPPGIPFPTNVEMVTAPTATQELIVYRSMPLTQLLAYLETSEFRAESQEAGLDKLTASIQEIAEQLSRTPGVSIGTDANLPISYPEPVANEFIGWDDQGDDLKNYSAAEILSLALAGILLSANNLSDVADAPTSATNLGLGATDNVNHNSVTLVADLSAAGVDSSGRLEFETFLDTATIATPANPAAGRFKLYVKADGNLYKLNDAGAEQLVGGVTFTDDLFRIQDDGDVTKQIAFQAAAITTGTTRTITMPDADVDLSSTGSFANRTLSNLGVTSINASLIPNGSLALGGAFTHWNLIYGNLFISRAAVPVFGGDFNNVASPVFQSGHSSGATNTAIATVQSGDQLSFATGTVGDLNLESGEIFNAANANPTGNVNIKTGLTAGAGARGKISLKDGSETGAGAGAVWTQAAADGIGGWSAPAAIGATIQLDNLGVTAVNADLTMDATKTVILKNDVALKGRNAGNTTDNDIIKLNANDDVEVGASMVPAAATNDLGLPAQRFRTTYLSDTLYIGATAADGGFIADGVASTLLADTFAFFASQVSKTIAFFTASSGTASITTGSVSIESGNAIGTTANSGGINLQTGTATATRGKISLLDGSEAGAGAGAVWTQAAADGVGGWSAPAPAGDAWGDPVDANIITDGGSRSIGTASAPFLQIRGQVLNATSSIKIINGSSSALLNIQDGVNMPSGASVMGMVNGVASSFNALGMGTINNATADAVATGATHIETGNKTAGTGNSGNIIVKTGTSLAGARGTISLDALAINHNQNPSTGFVEENGVTGSRPGSPVTAQVYFDTTLGLPIWYDGANWIDATGATV